MNQIILDVEWYDRNETGCLVSRDVLQIGAMRINNNGNIIDQYYSIICPENVPSIPDETYEFMHLSRAAVINSRTLKTVLKEFQEWCGLNSYSVILNLNAVNVLKEAYLKERLNYPFIGSITIQELYTNYYNLNRNVNFSNMCYNLGIEVNKDKLHISNYDATYCMQVYLKIRTSIIESVDRGVRYDMLYAVPNSARRMLHKINCGSIAGNLQDYYIISLSDIGEKRFTICKNCIMYDINSLIMRNRELNNHTRVKPIKPWVFIDIERIRSMCEEEGYKILINGREIFIDSGVSWWRFNPNRKTIKLYHSNDVYDFSPYGEEYHLQDRSFPDPYQAVQYIIAHDTTKYERLKKQI